MSDPRASLERLLGAAAVGVLRLPGGARELPLALPASEEQACALLELAAAERWRVLPLGLGSKLSWRARSEAEFALSTRALAGVVEYEPAEGVLTARAGTRMADLRALTAAERHWLTPFLAHEERATLGGVLSAGQSGLDRLRFGPVRHHVLGMRVALGDGTRTKCGGRLVKNVTGFDLQRLYTGAHGSLCLVLEASLRLLPAPRAAAFVEQELASPVECLPVCAAVEAGRLRPFVLALAGRERRWRLALLLGGFEEVVAEELRALRELLPAARPQEGPAALAGARAFADSHAPQGGRRLHGPPSLLPALCQALAAPLAGGAAATALLLPGVIALEIAGGDPDVAGSVLASSSARPARARVLEAELRRRLDPRGVFAEA